MERKKMRTEYRDVIEVSEHITLHKAVPDDGYWYLTCYPLNVREKLLCPENVTDEGLLIFARNFIRARFLEVSKIEQEFNDAFNAAGSGFVEKGYFIANFYEEEAKP